ncbi:hypothetical protein ACFE04_002202 [Oxalis oulophora]
MKLDESSKSIQIDSPLETNRSKSIQRNRCRESMSFVLGPCLKVCFVVNFSVFHWPHITSGEKAKMRVVVDVDLVEVVVEEVGEEDDDAGKVSMLRWMVGGGGGEY